MARMRRIQVVMDPELDDRLEQEAAARATSKSALIRELVERGLPAEPGDNGLLAIGALSREMPDIEPVEDIDEFLYGPLETGE
jgi:predicted DNA-binding protein